MVNRIRSDKLDEKEKAGKCLPAFFIIFLKNIRINLASFAIIINFAYCKFEYKYFFE